jgi:hypothetical protein
MGDPQAFSIARQGFNASQSRELDACRLSKREPLAMRR